MRDERGVLGRLKARGQEVLGQVSTELMSNPHFVKAMQGAFRGKEKLDQAVGRVLKTMNVPTRTEFKRALSRIEALEHELSEQKRREATQAAEAPPASPPRPRKKSGGALGGGGRRGFQGGRERGSTGARSAPLRKKTGGPRTPLA